MQDKIDGNAKDGSEVAVDIANADDLERQQEQQELIDAFMKALGWGKNDDPQNDARNSYKIPKESELYDPANELAKSLKCKKCLIIVKINEDGKLAIVGVKADGKAVTISDEKLSKLNKILGKLEPVKKFTHIKLTSHDNSNRQAPVLNKVASGVGTNKVKSQSQ